MVVRQIVGHVQAQNGATALHNAAGGGYNDVVKALLGAKADTDVQNGNCNTALHLASGKGGYSPLLCMRMPLSAPHAHIPLPGQTLLHDTDLVCSR